MTNGVPRSVRILRRHEFLSPSGRALRIYGQRRGAFPADLLPVEPVALHQRYDLLTDSWVAISPARNTRLGTQRHGSPTGCPFCPGGPEVPLRYDAAVIDNRWPPLAADPLPPPRIPGAVDSDMSSSVGGCEVVLYTEAHAGSLGTLNPTALARVIAVWQDRTAHMWAREDAAFVMAFENRGEDVGATISHPHGQIYAFGRMPPFIAARVRALNRARSHAVCPSCVVVQRDLESQRAIFRNRSFAVAVPFAARWPLEVHVRARRHGLRRLTDLTLAEQRDLAQALRGVVLRYDALFGFELPYMMVVLEAPDGALDWHLTVEFLPPNRTKRLVKVRASVETATGLFINDTLPETSARQLANLAIGRRRESLPFRVLSDAAPADRANS